jgi:hypothetical protein
MPGLTRYRRRILTTFPAAVFSDQIKSGVTGREYTYATRSFIGAPGLGSGDGGIGFAGIAGVAGAVGGGGVTVAAGAIGLPAARPPGAIEGGGGGTTAASNVGSAGAEGGGGITMVASTTGLPGAGSAGGIDGIGPFRRRAGVSAGFSTGGVTWTSAPGFGLGAVSLRRRFGWEAASRGTFAFRGPGAGLVASSCVGSVGYDFPRRGAPRGSSQIHFTAPLPPSVRMKFFFSRRCISSITQRFEKPVSLANSAISIWRPPRLGASALGAGINWINTRYRVASAAGMAPRMNSRLISDMRSPPSRILTDLGHRICTARSIHDSHGCRY